MWSRMCWGYQVGTYQYVEPISKTKSQGHRSSHGLIFLEATPGGEVQCQGKCTPASEQSNRHKETTKSQEEEYIAWW